MRRSILSAVLAVGLFIPAMLLGCNNYDATNEEETDMIRDMEIPQIDKTLPDEVETATFALG